MILDRITLFEDVKSNIQLYKSELLILYWDPTRQYHPIPTHSRVLAIASTLNLEVDPRRTLLNTLQF